MKGVVIAVVVLAMFELMVQPGWAISCGQVDNYLAPCVPYLIGGSGSPAPTCCDGVKNIKGMASTTADKQAACNCVKQAANRYSNLKDDAAQSLAAKCGVQMDIPISRTTNCDMQVFPCSNATCTEINHSNVQKFNYVHRWRGSYITNKPREFEDLAIKLIIPSYMMSNNGSIERTFVKQKLLPSFLS
ncbi:hypothetical protein LOK49_LG02G00826 [Camellia lanceoleosa]|uniref:Uncharacterized protein n=1 Tax=Camellia lanceoleosa TaxID=1840588 RepID=A0ACC0IPA6_9ERIC|nr:hypothetical protein LOK49_LG02G00826 [Camellia lanceoleosa]